MADPKKYVSLSKLGLYDEKIKALIVSKDATTLDSAKAYADSLADNYEAAGSVATAKSELEVKISAVDAKADTAIEANTATQGEVDALETLVGSIPETSKAASVVEYIDEKTAGIATDAALTELQGQVNTNKSDIAKVKDDYLKAADKTELSDAITAEAARADAAEKANATAIKAISDDYLKSDDKTTLEAAIAAAKKAGDDAQADIDAFMASAEVGEAAIDTLKEIQNYITTDGEAAAKMTESIAKNAGDISALGTKVGTIPAEGVVATDVVGYVQELVTAEKTRATGVEGGLDARLDVLEGKLGDGEGNVASQIAAAKSEAIATAAEDATSKANTAKDDAVAAAKEYTDTEVGKDRTRLDALEAASHSHDNKDLLDSYTQTEANLADAVAKKHAHDNAEVLSGITASEVAAWDKVSDKADQTALQNEIDRAKAAEEANAAAIALFEEVSEAEINALFAS